MVGKRDSELDAMQAVFAALSNLSDVEQRRVLEWVAKKLSLGGTSAASSVVAPSHGYSGAAAPKQGALLLTPKQFLAEKRPKLDIERVACLAYYLSHFRDTPEFKTKDLTLLNREAAQPALGNAAMAVSNAARTSQLLMPTSGGKKQLTTRGEALVEALPDRDRVREAMEANPLVGRKRRKPSRAASK